MVELPLLLAGPILRRADRAAVNIWLATSSLLSMAIVDLEQIDEKTGQARTLKTTTTFETVAVGRRLFVTLLSVAPERGQKLPSDTLIGYHITVRGLFGSRYSLDDLLSENGDGLASVTYPGMSSPAFWIQSHGSRPCRFLHGSCRKPHGGGEDSLAAGDELLENLFDNATPLDERPSVLFLTGDQIYADDVDDQVVALVAELAPELMGFEESIPGFTPSPPVPEKEAIGTKAQYPRTMSDTEKLTYFALANWYDLSPPSYMISPDDYEEAVFKISDLPRTRGEFVRTHAGFTTSAEGHLLTLGEYAAMYLVCWNPSLWPSREYNSEVSRFRDCLPRVRRLLANIPVYMQFDDHDVTDDWNLDSRWQSQTMASPAGRRIIANALACHWLFQAWGNSPPAATKDFRNELVESLESYRNRESVLSNDEAASYEELLLSSHVWTFVAPTYPLTVFIDTRTLRGADDDTYDGQELRAARLMNDEALEQMETSLVDAGFRADEPLIIVSGTPLYGYLPAEVAQAMLIVGEVFSSVQKPTGTYQWDLESWSASRIGHLRFVTFVAERLSPKYVVVLSGDVHYSFSTRIKYLQAYNYWDSPKDEAKETVIEIPMVQLTSSALKNEDSNTRNVIARRLPSFLDFPEPEKVPIWFFRKRHSPSNPDVVLVAESFRALPMPHSSNERSFAIDVDDRLVGVTNLGCLVVHEFEYANVGVEHVLFLRGEDGVVVRKVEIDTFKR